MARACAHAACRDEVDDFLAKDEFYEPLDANRITRPARPSDSRARRTTGVRRDPAAGGRV